MTTLAFAPTASRAPRDASAPRAKTAAALARLLADSYVLAVKTQGFHWNVTGPRFEPLHGVFQKQYADLASAIDEIAERIRALGVKAPGSFAELLPLGTVAEETGAPDAETMVRQLAEDHAVAARTATEAVATAEAAGDVGSADLATTRAREHEKDAWMLRSFGEK
jgi:starvation-inducible DNA-binding protein